MMQTSHLVSSFESVRETIANFCREREWGAYHLPASLTLALTGECGEVCEIFQWKGQLEEGAGVDKLTPEEVVHLGEEIADVFIYSTRLCDICRIDLSRAVQNTIDKIGPNVPSFSVRYAKHAIGWHQYSLDDFLRDTRAFKTKFRSQRQICFALQSEVGKVCDYFSRRPESESGPGLPVWPEKAVNHMTAHIASMCILLACLAQFHDISLSQCISDKFIKNSLKYPVEESRGSSAKYTNYNKKSASGTTGFFNSLFLFPPRRLETLDFAVRILGVGLALGAAAYVAHARGALSRAGLDTWVALVTGSSIKRIEK